jgi:hypothetical protein
MDRTVKIFTLLSDQSMDGLSRVSLLMRIRELRKRIHAGKRQNDLII